MKRLAIVAASALLCALFAIQTPLAVSAAEGTRYDYSREGDLGYIELSAPDVLARYLGDPLDQVERDFLLSHEPLSVRVSGVRSSSVRTEYHEENGAGELVARLDPDSYTAVNGGTVEWRPVSVDGEAFDPAGAEGVYRRGQIAADADDRISVRYETKVSVAQEDMNRLLTEAYDAGMGASEKLKREQTAYDEASRQYLAQEAALEKYDDDLAAYNAYLKEQSAWKRKSDAYAEYQRKDDDYQKALEAYEQYDYEAARDAYYAAVAAREQYEVDYAEYQRKLAAYREATSSPDMQTILYQLTVVKYLTKGMTSRNRALATSILGNGVTRVLENVEDGLELYPQYEKPVRIAESVTKILRELIKDYLSRTTDADRYAFYISCHDELTKNLSDLLRTLDYLYRQAAINSAVAALNSTEPFDVFLAQLYYICRALDDQPVANYYSVYMFNSKQAGYFDENWRIASGGRTRTPAEILGAENALEDRNTAAPLASGYPPLLDEPTEPDPVPPAGEMPVPMKKPQAPAPVVEPPGPAPEVVADPGERPSATLKPPVAYRPTAEESALAAAFEGGVLQKRSAVTEDCFIRLETTVRKYYRNAVYVTVRFYAHQDDESPAYVAEDVEVGTEAAYPLAEPSKQRTGYTCVFDGWMDADGNLVDLNALSATKDLDLYPHFRETPNQYRVVWTVGNHKFEDTCAYDARPVYDPEKFGPLQLSASGVRQYRFTGWQGAEGEYGPDEALPVMTEREAAYRAVFEASFVVTWSVAGSDPVSVSVWRGETPDYGGTPARAPTNAIRYTFTGWDKSIVPAEADAVYTAQFEADYLVSYGNKYAIVDFADGVYTARCVSAYATTFVAGPLFALAAEEEADVRLSIMGATLDFAAEDVAEAASRGFEAVEFVAAQLGTFSYSFVLKAVLSDMVRADALPLKATVTFDGTFDPEHSDFVSQDGEGNSTEEYVEFLESKVRFILRAGLSYRLLPRYDVGVIPSELVGLSVDAPRATPGQRVEVTLGTFAAGTYLGALYVRTADNTQVEVVDNSWFIMPEGPVSVGAVVAYYEYTVTFKADGKVLVVLGGFRYGDAISEDKIPTPYKAPEGEYRYVFGGWDRAFEPVTGDAEYNAVFTPELIPVGPQETTIVARILTIAKIVLPIFVVCMVLLIALIVFLKVRKKRRKRAANAQAASAPKAAPAPKSTPRPAAEKPKKPEKAKKVKKARKPVEQPAPAPMPVQEEPAIAQPADMPAPEAPAAGEVADMPMPETPAEVPAAASEIPMPAAEDAFGSAFEAEILPAEHAERRKFRLNVRAQGALKPAEHGPAPEFSVRRGRFGEYSKPRYGNDGDFSAPVQSDAEPDPAVRAAFGDFEAEPEAFEAASEPFEAKAGAEKSTTHTEINADIPAQFGQDPQKR